MQFWNISNLAIKNASSVSNINSNYYIYNKIFSKSGQKNKNFKILYRKSGKIIKFYLEMKEKKYEILWMT